MIYLPGLHGDWTLIGSFRRAVKHRLRLVQFTYPRTLDWTLDDYAAAVEKALEATGIRTAWLLGESFGSQILWSLAARKTFQIQGAILAGGFVQHPVRAGVRLAEHIAGGLPLSLLTRILFGYARVARFRYRRSPETRAEIGEFIARRTELDRQAAVHRLRLVAQSDFRPVARQMSPAVFALAGFFDPVVPWVCVRRWLRKNCPALRDCKIIRHADHNVLGTAPDESADQIIRWIHAT